MAPIQLILLLTVSAYLHEATGTSSKQYNSVFKRNTREHLMNHITASKSVMGSQEEDGDESKRERTPKQKRQRVTSVTIKSCNAEFCDPGWEPYPNIVSTVTGYNILKGNAYNLGTEQDPGFETGYIFVPVVKDDDDRYALHGGITIRAISKCDLSMNTKIVSTVKGYQNINREVQGKYEGWKTNPPVEISAKGVSTELPPLFEAFGAVNKALRQHEEFFTKRKGVLTLNDATCALYAMQISRRYPPPFQQPFKNAVKTLSEATPEQRKSEFHKFIQDFGTHYIQKATIGARLSIVRRYSRDTFKQATEEEVENCNKHRLAYFYVKEESGDNCTNLESVGESMIFKNMQREQIISYGSKPSDSLTDWANQEFESPVPIKMTLVPIIELFDPDFMQHDPDLKWTGYVTMKEWMKPMYDSYCEDMKADLGIEFCKPGAVKRCGYNDDCNPAYEDCVQTSASTYTCKAIITKAYLKEKVREAMNEITGDMKAVDVAKLIQSSVFDNENGIEGYVFARARGYGNLAVAGDNADKTEKDSFEVAYAWASSDKVGRTSHFNKDVAEAMNGKWCEPFGRGKIEIMNQAIRDINTSGHNVKFFIHASDSARPDHDKTGASEPSADYDIKTACTGTNQYIMIGPGGA